MPLSLPTFAARASRRSRRRVGPGKTGRNRLSRCRKRPGAQLLSWAARWLRAATRMAVAPIVLPYTKGETEMGAWLEGPQERAKKILGDKAQFPDEKPDMTKLQVDYGKAAEAFNDARSKLEDVIQEFENAITTF